MIKVVNSVANDGRHDLRGNHKSRGDGEVQYSELGQGRPGEEQEETIKQVEVHGVVNPRDEAARLLYICQENYEGE